MDRVLSARIDEAVLDELERTSRRLRMTKKQFLEEAIRLRAANAPGAAREDVWEATCGAWQRRESPAATVRRARRAFESAIQRHRQPA
jgi:hypothetical protein